MMIAFFGISFSIISGTTSVIVRLENSLDELIVENNMYMSFANIENIDSNLSFFKEQEKKLKDNVQNKKVKTPEDIAIEKYLNQYFGNNFDIFTLFAFLNAEKLLSTISFDDIFTNLNWKYSLSWYMSNESVDWGYQYFSLNDLKILQMISDYSEGEMEPLETYFLDDYRDVSLVQGNFLMDSPSENVYMNDFQIEQSSENGVNSLLTQTNDPNYDVRVGVGEDWANYNDVQVGDIIYLPQPNGKDFRAKVMFTFRVPQYIFPSFSLSKVIPDSQTQTYVVMNSINYLNYFGDVSDNKVYFGFNDLYNDIDTYSDYTSPFIKNRLKECINFLNKNILLAYSNFNAQLFDNLANTFGLNQDLTNKIDNYVPKQTEVKFQNKLSGEIEEKTVDVVPIVIDSINVQRLNVKEGDIIKTGFYDNEEQLNNFLELNSINNSGVAFEVVGIFDNSLPVGIFTTKPYLDTYINSLDLEVLMQINQNQEQYYSLLSGDFENNTNLQNDFQSNVRPQIKSIITKDGIEKQINIITNLLKNVFVLFSFFATLIALTLIIISIKEIADNSNHEVAILKANGFSNKRASRLILIPYIFIMVLAIILVIPIIIVIFFIINGLIFQLTQGMNFNIGVFWWQWLILCLMIILSFVVTIILIRIGFGRQATIKNL